LAGAILGLLEAAVMMSFEKRKILKTAIKFALLLIFDD